MCKHTTDISRQIETRDLAKKTIPVKKQEDVIRNFKKLINDIESRLELEKLKFDSPQKEEMFRLEIVMLVGAMDYYLFEIIKTGFIQIYNKERSSTGKFESLSIPMKYVMQALENPESTEWLYKSIMTIYGKTAFQNVEKINEVIISISNKKHWNEVAKKQGITKAKLQEKIKKLCMRRHQIVHKCDIPEGKENKENISFEFVKKQTKFIAGFINELHKLIII